MFVAILLVQVLVVAVMGLLGVWAGTSRRPWYQRAIVVCLALLLFLPIRAHEPAIAFLIMTPTVAIACWLLRGFLLPQATASDDARAPAQRRLRFGLMDLFALMLIAGLLLLFGMELSRTPLQMHYGMFISAALLFALTVVVTIAVHQRGWKSLGWWSMAMSLAIFAAAIHLVWMSSVMLPGDFLVLPVPSEVWRLLTPLLGSFFILTGLIALGSPLVTGASGEKPARWESLRQALAAVLLVSGAALLGVVYVKMLQPSPWPQEELPETNEGPQLFAVIKRFQEINLSEWTLADLRKLSNGDRTADELEALYSEIMRLVERDNIVHFDPRTDAPDAYTRYRLPDIQAARSVARTWHREAENAATAKNAGDVAKYDAMLVRLGSVYQRRGLILDMLVGVAVEGIGTHHLTTNRQQLGCQEIRQLLRDMQEISAQRESFELLSARDRTFEDRQTRWQHSLPRCVGELLGLAPAGTAAENAVHSVIQRRDGHFSLLMTDLAIRCFRETHGRLPSKLSELSPDYLNAVPSDPHTGGPLIYRVKGNEFELYSVGPDGVDNGGQFGPPVYPNMAPPGRDLDLDTFVRKP